MKIYDAVFFWLGGVLVPTLPELTMQVLTPDLRGHDFVHVREQLRPLADAVALGRLSVPAYGEAARAVCEARGDGDDLTRRLIAAATLRQPVAQVIRAIPAPYERWLVVDFPQAWYAQLPDRAEIDDLFPGGRVIFTEQLEMMRMIPDVFYRLPQKAMRPQEDCIIVDGDASRAVQSLQHGLASIFYVYVERLKLELALQEIWQTDADVMHPSASERVKFT